MTSPPQVADATAEDANASESPSWDSRDYICSESDLDGDAEQLDALDDGKYEQCVPTWGRALGSVIREWGQPSLIVMKIQILEIVFLKIEFLTQSTLKI